MSEVSRSNARSMALVANQEEKATPNMLLFSKIERLIARMQTTTGGVPIKTVKSFLTKIPDVFCGEDIISWLMVNLEIKDIEEAIHLGSLIASYGYFFPIDDHVITVKNDSSFYRFQSEFYWPSNGWDPDNTEYAVYLCKRTMQNKARLELADYEAENLARLQRTFSKSWEAIFARAEMEAKRDRKREKIQRKLNDSQERAFWDVHKPVPGCVNTTEVDIKKAYWYKNRSKKCLYNSSPRKTNNKVIISVKTESEVRDSLNIEIKNLKRQISRHCLKMSKVCETTIGYCEQQRSYDPLMVTGECSNPWISNDESYWTRSSVNDISPHRATKWKFSFGELLKDRQGCKEFRKFLEKEFSAENLDFYLACLDLKAEPVKGIREMAKEVYQEFLSDETPNPINIDSRVHEITQKNLENMERPDRYCFEKAQEHIYKLMKNDSYARFLKSDHYKSFLSPSMKASTNKLTYNRSGQCLADSNSES